MGLENIRIVLLTPLYGGNIGSVCRAMANMGLADLAIAAPRAYDREEARKMACHAAPILESIREYPTLAEAVADCGAVVGTTARTGLYRQHARPPREWAPRAMSLAATNKVAVVFGSEVNGLANEDLALCTQIVSIPTRDAYTALNLSQAVLVCAYELFLASGEAEPRQERSPEAHTVLRERMFEMWERALLQIGFMSEDKAEHMMLGLRRILGRGSLTTDDARILMGIARQTLWATRNGIPAERPAETMESDL